MTTGHFTQVLVPEFSVANCSPDCSSLLVANHSIIAVSQQLETLVVFREGGETGLVESVKDSTTESPHHGDHKQEGMAGMITEEQTAPG